MHDKYGPLLNILIDTAGKSHTNIIFTQCVTVSGTKIISYIYWFSCFGKVLPNFVKLNTMELKVV
jgi:hypothetical protein